ncbi:MAG: GNAT family N-acetyltransferase [Pseudomonadota bacterium]
MEIAQYTGDLQDQIISLILNIQRNEFGLDITEDDQPDLKNIQSFYQKNGGNFWVAIADGVVVGTVALLYIGDENFALRKMFVQKEYRGHQNDIAGKLLKRAENWATAKCAKGIYLGTTERFHAAHRFYRKNDYIEVTQNMLPKGFPIMFVDILFFGKML